VRLLIAGCHHLADVQRVNLRIVTPGQAVQRVQHRLDQVIQVGSRGVAVARHRLAFPNLVLRPGHDERDADRERTVGWTVRCPLGVGQLGQGVEGVAQAVRFGAVTAVNSAGKWKLPILT
jgi:hypothetical protein